MLKELSAVYDARETGNIGDWVLESLTGMSKIDRVMYRDSALSPTQSVLLHRYIPELLAHRPVQYVLQEAWFVGMRFYVDEAVLIPRPETEELVEWVVEEELSKSQASGARSWMVEAGGKVDAGRKKPDVGGIDILDIGTGSGCISIALKKKFPGAMVHACDVSEAALAVARRNAAALEAPVSFHLVDVLRPAQWDALPMADIIVSNPPYIPVRDKSTMHDNVLLHEPHLALFVPDEDALLFYRAIAGLARDRLRPGGSIYVEIHEDLGPATVALFQQQGYETVQLRKDLQGKDRMLRAE